MLNEIVLKFGEAPGSLPLRIQPGAMTVLVGPNNSGKSLTLREIQKFILKGKKRKRVAGTPTFHIIDSISPQIPSPGELLDLVMAEVEQDIAPFREPLLAAAKLTPSELLNNFNPTHIMSILNELNQLEHLRHLASQKKIDPSLLDAFDKERLAQQPSLSSLVIEFLNQLLHYLERNQALLESITSLQVDSPGLGLIRNRAVWLEGYLHHFAKFTTLLDGKNRLGLSDPEPAGSLHEFPTNMMMRLFHQPDEMEKLRAMVFDAFQCYLALDLTNMQECQFVISDKHPGKFETNFGSVEAVEYFSSTRDIFEFSDGVKSYIGLHATVMSHDFRVVLVDEPEAFLHPPLARRLGYNLTKLAAERGASVISATHSPFFLMGCIEAQQKVNIVRLGYLGGIPTARALPSEELQTMMNDPLLRSSGILNALFHRSAVVCEGDSDQSFYDEINERLRRETEKAGGNEVQTQEDGFARDCLFMNAHGKHSVAPLVGALRRMGIPSVGVVDLDLLKDAKAAGELLRCTGSGSAARDSVNTMRGKLLGYFEQEYEEQSAKEQKITASDNTENKPSAISLDSLLKRGGLDNLSVETAKRDLKLFLDLMAGQGIFIPEKGELEGWLSELKVGVRKGRGWLAAMFNKMGSLNEPDSYMNPSGDDVWDFMRRIAKWIGANSIDPPKEEMKTQK